MFLMYDDVDLSLIPPNPQAVGCYRNGADANEHAARLRFPHAHILPISVTGLVPCDAYDLELGDYPPEQGGELVLIAHKAGIWRPCLYASLDNWPIVDQSLDDHQIPRAMVRKWQAHWDGVSVVPAGFDAKQFTSHADGRSLDESICLPTFFPSPAPRRDRVARALVELDTVDGHWRINRLAEHDEPVF